MVVEKRILVLVAKSEYDATKCRYRTCSKMFSIYSDGKSPVDKRMNGNNHKTSMEVFQGNFINSILGSEK